MNIDDNHSNQCHNEEADSMNRQGKIVQKLNEEEFKIVLLRHTACGDCGACSLGDENKDVYLDARNSMVDEKGYPVDNIEVGDVVEVEMGTNGILSAAFIMYIIPLAALILGSGISYLILENMTLTFNGDFIIGGVGMVCALIAFLGIRLNEEKFKKNNKYSAHITNVVMKKENQVF